MAESTVVYTPDNQANGVLPWMLANNGGFGSFNNIADLFGLAIIASMFGWGNGGWGGGFGGWGGGNAGTAGFLSNQLNNDSGRELIMNAITSNGEATRSAVQNLATALGQDFNLVNAGVQNVQNALSTLALQQAVSVPQIINAISSGDASIISKFSECCCAQKLLTVEQGYQSQIATLNQTNQLGSQADRNTRSITDAIAAQTVAMNDQFCALKEREMQAKIDTQADIITQLRGQIDNAAQTAQFAAMLAPIQAQVNTIASKQINTVPVAWPNLQAVNTTPYVSGGIYGGYGYGYGNNGLVF